MRDAPGKIVLFYAWGTQNVGDYALNVGALEALSRILPEQRLTVVSRYASGETSDDPTDRLRTRFPGVNVVPCPFSSSRRNILERFIQSLQALVLMSVCLMFPQLSLNLFGRREAIREIGTADLVLLNGGNLFYWHKYRRSPSRLIAFAFPLLMARRLGIPYGFLPQTSGPFEGRASKLIGKLFEGAKFALFRDEASLRNVEGIADLSNTDTAVVPDLAYFISPRESPEALEPFDLREEDVVAVTVRTAPLGYPAGLATETDDPQETLATLKAFLPEALASVEGELGKQIVLVAQTLVDIGPSYEISDQLSRRHGIEAQVVESRNLEELLSLYRASSLLVGMRMHSLIFALSQETPVVGLWREELGMKIPAMLTDMNLADYAFELNSTSPDAFSQAVVKLDRERETVIKRASSYLERKSDFTLDFLRTHVLDI